MGNLSPHFSVHEWACPCHRNCTAKLPAPLFLNFMELLRKRLNAIYDRRVWIVMQSGLRCPPYDLDIGKSSNGLTTKKHPEGVAADFRANTNLGLLPPNDVAHHAHQVLELYNDKFQNVALGVGLADTWLHLDLRADPTSWTY